MKDKHPPHHLTRLALGAATLTVPVSLPLPLGHKSGKDAATG